MNATTEPLHPRIGTLCREGRTVYYAYLTGVNGPLYLEDTVPYNLEFYIRCEERDGSTYRAGIKDNR